MRQKAIIATFLLLGSMVLGATVLREPLATAATPFMNVIIANDAQDPVPVQVQGTVAVSSADNPAQPVRADLFQEDDSYTVPAGKRLVIQEVTGRGDIFEGDYSSRSGVFRLDISRGNVLVGRPLFFASDGVAFAGGTDWYMTEQATVYAEAGETITHAFFVPGVANEFGEMTIIGYLIDV